ncbi:ribonuclease H-like domain-containing protein, partial [Ephemerocybe angulata]
VYADGSCLNNGTKWARAGSGAYAGPSSSLNFALRVPDAQTNNRGEVYAILQTISRAPPHKTLHIFSDSEYAMDTLVQRGPDNDARGWDITNGDLFRDIVKLIQSRPAPLKLIQVKGHSGLAMHDNADALAKEGA